MSESTAYRLTLAIRIVAGVIFVVFGAGKFVNHAGEAESFAGYGLPLPGLTVVLIGIVELAGGALLLAGRLVRPAAAVLAANMTVAFLVAGVGHGEVIPSLTLAPALLAAMLFLVFLERR